MSLDPAAPTQLGNYDILSKIAEGGMGTVYKARNRVTGEIVAVKVIAPTTAKNSILLQRFEREFMAAKVLDHPNVVKAIEYCGTGPYPFLVMEFVDGESFGQRVERKGPYPEAEAIRLIAQVCEGLHRAHKQGLVHRDVKPDNILVTREGVAKLTDMGLVKDVDGDLNLTKTGRGLGTPHYMAPEQFRNAKGVDVRGDIYSLGATLYAMVTGQVPFENASPLDCWMKKIRNEFPSPKDIAPHLSDRIDWAIRRAMSAEPDRRPSSCREFVEDLTGQSRTTPARPGPSDAAAANQAADVWYLVYKDETGVSHTVKGSTEGIRKALRDNLLGDTATVLVSRTKTGQFVSVASAAEFRDLIVNPAVLPSPIVQRGSGASGVLRGGAAAAGPLSGRYRQPTDDAAVDLGGRPDGGNGASRAGRSNVPAAAGRATPANNSATRRTPAPTPTPVDPKAETEFYPPHRNQKSSKSVLGRKSAKAKKPFDWTPVLVVLVMILSATVGVLLFTR